MFRRSPFLALAMLWASTVGAAPIVWSSYEATFTKGDEIDPFAPGGFDALTPSVSLSRLNAGGGLLNVASETTYRKAASPAGTLWAFPYSNPNRVVAAWNYAELVFLPWADSFGSNSAGGPPATIGQPAVVHVVAENVYLDICMTAWTVRTGGGFAYKRAIAPLDDADYDGDRDVDGNDFLTWQRDFGLAGAELLSDGNGNGLVDDADFVVWGDSFGHGNGDLASVPEPSWGRLMLAYAMYCSATFSRRTKQMHQPASVVLE